MRTYSLFIVPVTLAVALAAACSSSSGGSGAGGTGGESNGSAGSGGVGAGGVAAGSGGTASAGAGGASAGGASGAAGSRSGGASGADGGAVGGTAGAADAGSNDVSSRGGTSGTDGGTGGAAGAVAANPATTFFVSSDTSMTGNLGGLVGADARCQKLAVAAGLGQKTWRAYLSAMNPKTDARDRIGAGPYVNSRGMMIGADKAALHARPGDAALFLDEKGNRINGQWAGSPSPNQHDILTGTKADGTVNDGLTCSDWTATTGMSGVGHCDGLGPAMATTGTFTVWNASHTGQCANTTPGGGAGRIYCLVGN